MKIKETQLKKLEEAGLREGFFTKLVNNIKKMSNAKIQKIVDKSNKDVAALLKDMRLNPEKYKDLVAEKVLFEDSIQFEQDIPMPGNGMEFDDSKLDNINVTIDDNVVSTSLLNQIDYRGLDK